MSFWASEESYH